MSKYRDVETLTTYLAIGSGVVFALNYCIVNGLLTVVIFNSPEVIRLAIASIVTKSQPYLWLINLIFVAALYLGNSFTSAMKRNKERRKKVLPFYLMFTILFVVNFKAGWEIYNLLIAPFGLTVFILTPYVVLPLQVQALEPDAFKGLNKLKTKFSPVLSTKKGKLSIYKPNRHTMIIASPGGGKSKSLNEPIIHEHMKQGIPQLIFDQKGNPTTLGRYAYMRYLQTPHDLSFGMINFADIPHSMQTNLMDEDYVTSDVFLYNLVQNFMLNLNPDWIKKTDFWGLSAMAITYATVLYNFEFNKKCSSLPHAICMLLKDFEVVMEYVSQDEQIVARMESVAGNLRRNVLETLQNQLASAQNPLQILYNETVFYVLNGKKGSDNYISLDCGDPENKKVLVVCNNNEMEKAISPVVSALLHTSLSLSNRQSRKDSGLAFTFDEAGAIFLSQFSRFMAQARSNNVMIYISTQVYSQFKELYQEHEAASIIGTCGNAFFGSLSDFGMAEQVAKSFGRKEFKKINKSSNSASSEINYSEVDKKELNIEVDELMELKEGEFVGRIAGGEPVKLRAQFDYIDDEDLEFSELPLIGDFKRTQGMPVKVRDILVANKLKDNWDQIHREVDEALAPFTFLVNIRRELQAHPVGKKLAVNKHVILDIYNNQGPLAFNDFIEEYKFRIEE